MTTPEARDQLEAIARVIDPRPWKRFEKCPPYAAHISRKTQIEWTLDLQPSLKKAAEIIAIEQQAITLSSKDAEITRLRAALEAVRTWDMLYSAFPNGLVTQIKAALTEQAGGTE